MNPRLKLTAAILLIATTALISCSKDSDNYPRPSLPPPIPDIFQPRPTVIIIGNKEYHWGVQWDTSANGYKIIIGTVLLTQDAINRGVDVYVAPWSEMSVFEKLPYSYPPFGGDTISFSYSAMPGQLKVYATTNQSRAWDMSDIYIEYK
ncbi:MAG TPA: hypothetical protein VHQ93_01090 [Chitinophagaceae bacterium]|jgi:hypothetical protein|nr:hypothetical protein [Chitinophagaceae bacterium]